MSGLEVIAVVSSITSIIQITDRIIGLCKYYIKTARDAPSDLRLILLETSTLKTIFENVQFLIDCSGEASATVRSSVGPDGPIEGCLRSISDLEKLFPSDCVPGEGQIGGKKRKVKATLLALAWPLKESKAKKLLDEITRYKTTISLALTTESFQDIRTIKQEALEIHEMLTDSQRHEIYRWLHCTDPSPLHYRARKDYELGTGNWMLRSANWTDLVDAKQRCLWIHGIPGAGKTVLMSYLIEQIKQHCDESSQQNCTCVYYYCYFGHSQDEAAPFLRWLLNQLCRKANLVPRSVYKMHKYGGEPSLVELLKALEDILDAFDIVYVVVDAIDESAPREDLLKVLRDIVTDPRFKKIQLLASSREYIDIERVMRDFSVSVSMANPFVEEDIRRHVRSTLHSNSKFGHWPQKLLEEVEDALSTGAKGMFRWAVCQIDILQRLKCERNIVKKALENLPKTLDETYNRIFLSIPEEERPFVYYALVWISYHNELHGNGIPCSVLLQAVTRSTAMLNDSQNDRFYDNDILREICGCLINIELEDMGYGDTETPLTALTVTFAHYTVREYLDSNRISGSMTSFITCNKTLKHKFMEIIFSEAQHMESNELEESRWDTALMDSSDVHNAITEDFGSYCIVSALLSLYNVQHKICQHNNLCTLALKLLDPSEPHFKTLCAVATQIARSLDLFFLGSWLDDSQFWRVKWDQGSSTEAAYLFYLLLLTIYRSENLALAKKFLQGKDAKVFLQSRLTFQTVVFDMSIDDMEVYKFDGSIVEVFAQLVNDRNHQDGFKLLLEYDTGHIEPSKVLMSFIGSHDHSRGCKEYCLLERLLKLGADPNGRGYQVTPLQIAVVSRDYEGVDMLLKARADPNGTGETDGIAWEEGTLMNRFNHLHNASPLYISREFERIFVDRKETVREETLKELEATLLQYGAEAFFGSCNGLHPPSSWGGRCAGTNPTGTSKEVPKLVISSYQQCPQQ